MRIRIPRNGWAAYRRLCLPAMVSGDIELLVKHAFTAGMFTMQEIYFTAGLDETEGDWASRLELVGIELEEMVRESREEVCT